MSTFRPRSHSPKVCDLLPPERPKGRAASHVSGQRLVEPSDIEDAEFVVISRRGLPNERSARPSATDGVSRPQNDNRHPKAIHQAVPRASRDASIAVWTQAGDAHVFSRGVMAGEKLLRRLSENMFSALVAGAFLLVFALSGGISAFASGGSTGEVRPSVEISHMTVTPKNLNGMAVLVLNGVIENHGATTISSPRLRADMYTGNLLVASTLFRTHTGEIGTGESRGFQVKVPQTGGKTPDIRISLAE